jgi:mono/diheme cytochrome c family protein
LKYILNFIIILAVLGLAALIYLWSGFYNIAATKPHWNITLSLIETLRDRSIAVHSKEVPVPDLDDPKFRDAGFSHYHEMCRFCHGAPGYQPEEFAIGLYPVPPDMISGNIQKARSDAEIYWIVKYGIKMTGMPAFGPTHEEDELWGLTVLVKEIPRMAPDHYRQLVEHENGTGHGHGHAH